MRGISDILIKSADADLAWQPIAADHAAAFAVEVLTHLDYDVKDDRPPDLLTQLGVSTDITTRLDRLRKPVEDLFGGIGSCSEMGYRGRDWDLVELTIHGHDLDLFFDKFLDHAFAGRPIDDVERRDIDDHIRELPVHGALLVSERPLHTGELVNGDAALRTWTIGGCEYVDIDDQIIVAVHAPRETSGSAYTSRLLGARDYLRDELHKLRSTPSTKRQLEEILRTRTEVPPVD